MPKSPLAAAAEGMPINKDAADKIMDAETLILRAKNLTDLLAMAGEGLVERLRDEANAIVAGCGVLDDVLQEALDLLEGVRQVEKRKGGAA